MPRYEGVWNPRLIPLTLSEREGKKECPAMKGFETPKLSRRVAGPCKKECPAMKGFETRKKRIGTILPAPVRRNAPLWRGLKQYLTPEKNHTTGVRRNAPLWRGLKRATKWLIKLFSLFVRRNAPLWRGLKHGFQYPLDRECRCKKECPAMKGFETPRAPTGSLNASRR